MRRSATAGMSEPVGPDVTRTVDRLEIAELFARYAWAMDRVDRDMFLGVWTDDAEWIADGAPIRCMGRDAISEYFDRTAATRASTPDPGSSVRLVGSPIITFDGPDAARVRSEMTAFTFTGSAVVPYSLGYYDDALVRESGRWLIRRRHMVVCTALP